MSSKPKNRRKVGFGSPPEETQFKAGNRANPWGRKGRPDKVRPLDPDRALAAFFAEQVEVLFRGKPQKVSNYEACLRVLGAKALKGDMAAMKLLFSIAMKTDLSGIFSGMAREAEEKEDQVLQEAAREIMLLWAPPECSSNLN